MKKSVPQQNEKQKSLNALFSTISDIYSEETRKLVYLCYKKKITQREIGEALGTTRENVAMLYPKKKGKNGK